MPPILQAVLLPFNQIPSTYRPVVMAIAVVGIIGLKNATTYISQLVITSLQRQIDIDLRRDGLMMLFDADLSYHTSTRMGDITNRLGAEIGRVSMTIANTVQVLTTSLSVLVMAGILFALSWELTLFSTLLFGSVIFVNQYFISRAKVYGKRLSEASKEYSIALIEILSGIRLVKTTATETQEFNRLLQVIKFRARAEFDSQANANIIGPINEMVSIIALMSMVVISRWLFADQMESVSTILLTYLSVLFRLLPLVGQLNRLRSTLSNTSPSVDIVNDFLKRDNKPFLLNGSQSFPGIQKEIAFEEVSFAYYGSQELCLQDISLVVPKGTTLALVGGSGAGKSTLADLVPRFADPVAGRIAIDGHDLREFDMKTLRRSMGIVSQDTFMFSGSVRNNIAYGCAGVSDEQVVEAAKLANALEFIEKLPKGFDTPIGDRGVLLSGGQRQRIAIARALLQNPPILILDEATSALDTVSERLVQEALERLSRDRTSIVIAHRLSTVQQADQIAVMEKGRVVEVGTHSQLLAADRHYAMLYNMQFAGAAQQLVTANETFNRTSYEIRSRLNITLGSLRLLVDDLVDSNEERNELLQESYKSAIRMLSTMELFEDSLQMQRNSYAKQKGSHSAELSARYEELAQASYSVRTQLNVMIGTMRFLIDDLADTVEESLEMTQETYNSAISIFDTLEALESKGNRV
jgi:subfamily B ATP-binding cassette protein MsbA